MSQEEEAIIERVIQEVLDSYNYVPETLAEFNEYERLLRIFKKWEEYI